ncbi:MAG: hypothetical protein GXO90_00525 [FCB group bacterium]|nr:hypothetical protein [FCB group bacterium]
MMEKKRLLIIGQFSLFFGILGFLVNTFVLESNHYLAFITGILLGLSFILNLVFLTQKKSD